MHCIVRARWIGEAMIEADLAPDLSGGGGVPRIVVAAPDADGRNGDRRWISHLEHLDRPLPCTRRNMVHPPLDIDVLPSTSPPQSFPAINLR